MTRSRNRRVALIDLAVLIAAVGQAAKDPDVGFVDADRSLLGLLRELSPFVFVSPEVLESALAHANYLDEQGKFSDFRGGTFDQLTRRLGDFNRDYNWFNDKK